MFSIVLSVLILIAGFTEILVFNEEILLALCFVSFVFCAFCFLSDTVFSIFAERSAKIESDLAVAYQRKLMSLYQLKQSLVSDKYINVTIGVCSYLDNQLVTSLDLQSVTSIKQVLANDAYRVATDLITLETKLNASTAVK